MKMIFSNGRSSLSPGTERFRVSRFIIIGGGHGDTLKIIVPARSNGGQARTRAVAGEKERAGKGESERDREPVVAERSRPNEIIRFEG